MIKLTEILKSKRWIGGLMGVLILIASCEQKPGVHQVNIDGTKNISGQKLAIKDINPELPMDWSDYHYVVLEMRVTSPQRFHIGFTTATGYNEMRIHSYTAGGWSRYVLPLALYREAPKAHFDVAGLNNKPRQTSWFNIGGERHPLVGVDSIGFRFYKPIGDGSIELRSMTLAHEDPGDQYLGDTPVLDRFGQWNLADFEGKIQSIVQLEQEWQTEDSLLALVSMDGLSRYGGDLSQQVEPTGFFRTELIGGRWWFVDPDGYLFLSLGVDVVNTGEGGDLHFLDQRSEFYEQLPPEEVNVYTKKPGAASFGNWNLYRRHGADFKQKAEAQVIDRMTYWGLNTIANWSNNDIINRNEKPFMLQLEDIGIHEGVLGMPNIYEEGFADRIDESIRSTVEPYVHNSWLIGYFVANEPAWYGREERLLSMIQELPDEHAMKLELQKYIKEEDSPTSRRAFIVDTFEQYLKLINQTFRKYDPNHMLLGMRFSHVPEEDLLKICGENFDVFSFNCYEMFPKPEVMDQLLEMTGTPLVIGEYHFGTSDRGMSQGLVQVENQAERGEAYQYYTEQAFAHPGMIGVAYFQWADEDLAGRGYDGENYNCGLIDVTDRPYPHMVDAMKRTAERIYPVHHGQIAPVDSYPPRYVSYDWPPEPW